ncbi:toll/interleukin-1 receptor domain-containing protein [Marinomonas sp. S3726]|uniref:toll/interleukin-1 receptor domain-containing protein n=1 Tax=Marinomonas sp. S3726 TaxID=579484 RepID=UPI0006964692|nr:toll/interleukin-1 receptor domain-containing protein [Marinomonas sp. S3726]
MRKDIFICHACEDKSSIIRPLVHSLSERGISCWVDEAEIFAGESISEKINEGLRESDFVVVIISRSFMAKNWPRKELSAVLNLEAKSGRAIIIPILVGTQNEIDSVVEEFPLLNDKLFLLWNGDANRVANTVQMTVLKSKGQLIEPQIKMHTCGHCSTPFQHGVHVCLGCHGTVIYGLSNQERFNIRRNAIFLVGFISLLTMTFFPFFSSEWIGQKIPMFWGLGLWSVPSALITMVIGGYFFEARSVNRNSHLIRVFR